jgi:hypothetical protein
MARGLPLDCAERLVQELSDHAEDLRSEFRDDQRIAVTLGDPESLAVAAATAYRAGSFAGRNPALGFLAAPMMFTLLGCAVYTVLADLVIEACSAVTGSGQDPVISSATTIAVRCFGLLVPLAVVVWSWVAYRQSGRPLFWYLAAAWIVASLAGWLVIECKPRSPALSGFVFVEFSEGVDEWQAAQAALPLLLSLGLALRSRFRSRSSPTSPLGA